jgi:hypothetical protein
VFDLKTKYWRPLPCEFCEFKYSTVFSTLVNTCLHSSKSFFIWCCVPDLEYSLGGFTNTPETHQSPKLTCRYFASLASIWRVQNFQKPGKCCDSSDSKILAKLLSNTHKTCTLPFHNTHQNLHFNKTYFLRKKMTLPLLNLQN